MENVITAGEQEPAGSGFERLGLGQGAMQAIASLG